MQHCDRPLEISNICLTPGQRSAEPSPIRNDAHSGGAFFTAKINGQDIKGSIFCGVGEKGAAVSIVYDRKDAPADEWDKLISSLPTKTKTQVYQFPDGTGSVELPEGWKTTNQSVVGGVKCIDRAPPGQVVTLGQGRRGNYARFETDTVARSTGGAGPPNGWPTASANCDVYCTL